MNHLNVILPILLIGSISAEANDTSSRDNFITVFGTHHSANISDNNKNTYGLAYDTEKTKISVIGASDIFATSILLKIDPLEDKKWFVKTGAGYSYQQFSMAKLTSLCLLSFRIHDSR